MKFINCPVDKVINDDLPSLKQWTREIAQTTSLANSGKINVTGTITLNVSSTTTTLNDPRILLNSFISYMPQTANAAASLGVIYTTVALNGTATIHHSSNTQADRTYTYIILG